MVKVRDLTEDEVVSMVKVRDLTEDEVEFSISRVKEDHEPDFESDDKDADERDRREIRRRLDRGDLWAWCCVKVTAKWNGFEGVDYLGGCSYDGDEDFKKGGYWPDMKHEALAELNRSVAETFAKLWPLAAQAELPLDAEREALS